MTQPSDQLIADVYAVLAEPERLQHMEHTLDRLIASGEGSPPQEALYHFDKAADLLAAAERAEDAPLDPFAKARGDSPGARSAALVLDDGLKLVSADSHIFAGALPDTGVRLPDWVWFPGSEGADTATMRGLLAQGEASGALRLRRSPADQRGALFTVTTGQLGGTPHLLFHHMGLRWNTGAGAAFADLLSLTKSEVRVLRWLVGGGTLRELADRRGTALGTVRNQTKSLLRKIGAVSQIEAVCMWAGFRQRWLDSQPGPQGVPAPKPAVTLHVSGCTTIRFERYGRLGGTPVLYFHPMMGGPHMPASADAALAAAGVELISPWRPGYGTAAAGGDRLQIVRDFVDCLPPLLDRLAMGRVRVLAAVGGAPYALAFARRHEGRTRSVTLAGATVPITGPAEMGLLTTVQTLPLRLARRSRVLNRWYVHAALARMRKADSADFARNWFAASAQDTAWLEAPCAQSFLRDALNEALALSSDFAVGDSELNALDWTPLFAGLSVPVQSLYGAGDAHIPPALASRAASAHGFVLPDRVAGAGSFLPFQRPDAVIEALLSF